MDEAPLARLTVVHFRLTATNDDLRRRLQRHHRKLPSARHPATLRRPLPIRKTLQQRAITVATLLRAKHSRLTVELTPPATPPLKHVRDVRCLVRRHPLHSLEWQATPRVIYHAPGIILLRRAVSANLCRRQVPTWTTWKDCGGADGSSRSANGCLVSWLCCGRWPVKFCAKRALLLRFELIDIWAFLWICSFFSWQEADAWNVPHAVLHFFF